MEKENLDVLPPPDKKRKLGVLVDANMNISRPPTAIGAQGRATLSRQAGKPATDMLPGSNKIVPRQLPGSGVDASQEVSLARADVEALLGLKMTGKNKYDYKGKSEQCMEYIRKLRACILGFQAAIAAECAKTEQVQEEAETSACEYQHRLATTEQTLLQKDAELAASAEHTAQLQSSLRETTTSLEEAVVQNKESTGKIADLVEELAKRGSELATSQEIIQKTAQQVATLQEINSRVQEYNASLQQYNSHLQADVATASEAAKKAQEGKANAVEEIASLRGKLSACQEALATAQQRAEDAVQQMDRANASSDRVSAALAQVTQERDSCQAEALRLAGDLKRFQEATGKTSQEFDAISSKVFALEEAHSSQRDLISQLRQQLDTRAQRLLLAEGAAEARTLEAGQLRARVSELEAKLAAAEQRVHDGEVLRRKLHNAIQELKGSIRVFCRVRPLMPEEDGGGGAGEGPAVSYPALLSNDLQGQPIELAQSNGSKHAFTFDRVFGPDTSQADVFEEIEQLVQSALDGYKVCIFAYGQTGSGKTYTMLGQPSDAEHRGLIPRSLEQIFETSQKMRAQGWSFCMQASMLEIYNEAVRDLLAPASSASAAGARGSGVGAVNSWDVKESSAAVSGGGKSYAIKHDAKGNTSVSDLTVVEVASWQEVSGLLSLAAMHRRTGKTAMNERSSRSHCVFTLRISCYNSSTQQSATGVLNLIDLAGSERLSRSQATGDRLKETQAINKSLSSLGDVICAIANREPHVPFRNSKLTYLLQPCLGGDAKTLMFVNVAPDKASLGESLCSLRFASKVSVCEIGTPRRQIGTAARAESSDLMSARRTAGPSARADSANSNGSVSVH